MKITERPAIVVRVRTREAPGNWRATIHIFPDQWSLDRYKEHLNLFYPNEHTIKVLAEGYILLEPGVAIGYSVGTERIDVDVESGSLETIEEVDVCQNNDSAK